MGLFGIGKKVSKEVGRVVVKKSGNNWKDLVKKHLRQGHSLKESLRMAKSEYKKGL